MKKKSFTVHGNNHSIESYSTLNIPIPIHRTCQRNLNMGHTWVIYEQQLGIIHRFYLYSHGHHAWSFLFIQLPIANKNDILVPAQDL